MKNTIKLVRRFKIYHSYPRFLNENLGYDKNNPIPGSSTLGIDEKEGNPYYVCLKDGKIPMD